jgi:tRNA-dihydrouridine synthase
MAGVANISEDWSIIKYEFANFHQIVMTSRNIYPNPSLLAKLVLSMIEAENEPDEDMKKRVNWIYENTHKEVMEHLSTIELVVIRNIMGSLNKEIEIGSKTFTLTALVKYLDELSAELMKMVVKIGKKYSLEMPTNMMFGSTNKVTLT